MTRLSWLLRATCLMVLLVGARCGGTTHIVGQTADGSAGVGGTASAGGVSGAGGSPGRDAPLGSGGAIGAQGGSVTGGTIGSGGSGSPADAALPTGGATARGGATGTDGPGGTVGKGGNAGAASGGAVATGGVAGTSGAGGRGGSPMDGPRLCSGAPDNCCFLDGDCKNGLVCAGATCTADKQLPGACEDMADLKPGQCWRDADCPAGSSGCRSPSICPCGSLCSKPDQPGTCAMPGGTGGAAGSGGVKGTGGSSGTAGSTGDGGLDAAGTVCEQRGGTCGSVALTADAVAWCPTLSGTTCRLPAAAHEGALGCAAPEDGAIAICCLPEWEQPESQCASAGMVCYPRAAGVSGDVCPLGWATSNALCETMNADCCDPPISPTCPPWP